MHPSCARALPALVLCALAACPAVLVAADPADVAAAKARVGAIGSGAVVSESDGRVTGITIPNGSAVTAEDLALFGRLDDLETLHILNCRGLDDGMVDSLRGLARLRSLALTNTAISDAAVATIAEAFPGLVELDLSSNTGLTGAAMKGIALLANLERLGLLQTRFNDLHTRRLKKLEKLRVLDLRGNMEAGDATLGVLGGLPHLEALKHRSTIVSDDGLAALAASKTLRALLVQDFAITSDAGRHLAALPALDSLEIFRCQGFGSEGVLALAPLDRLERLTLRDLPEVDDAALAVLAELPALERLALHELPSVSDAGLKHLEGAKKLRVLDLWALPRMTDATLTVIAGLPALEELSIRETGATKEGLDALAARKPWKKITLRR